MTYLLLVGIFVGIAAVVLAAVVRSRARAGGRSGPSLAAIGWSFAALTVLTAVFDNLMIAAGLVEYDEEQLVGLWIGRAPVEDFGYPAAVVLLMPALWHLLGGSRSSAIGDQVDSGAAEGRR